MPTEETLLDRVAAWHQSDSAVPLHEYLGMAWSEYSAWVEQRSARDQHLQEPGHERAPR